MHDAGVNTPEAALVAAATAGLDSDLHIPNVRMFVSGTKSLITAKRTADTGRRGDVRRPGEHVKQRWRGVHVAQYLSTIGHQDRHKATVADRSAGFNGWP
jgi:hypothetical protein